MILTKEEMIQQVKDCGFELINNAENIVNDFKYGTQVTISCCLDWRNDRETPLINVETELIPERFIKRLQTISSKAITEFECTDCVYEGNETGICFSCNRMNDCAKNDWYMMR